METVFLISRDENPELYGRVWYKYTTSDRDDDYIHYRGLNWRMLGSGLSVEVYGNIVERLPKALESAVMHIVVYDFFSEAAFVAGRYTYKKASAQTQIVESSDGQGHIYELTVNGHILSEVNTLFLRIIRGHAKPVTP